MTCLYRPTLHQIQALHWPTAGSAVVMTYVHGCLTHIAKVLDANVVGELRAELDSRHANDSLVLKQRDLRYPLVRSKQLYATSDSTPLKVAFYAYQEGTEVLLHAIWLWDGDGDAATFHDLQRQMLPAHGTDLAGYLGEGRLLTAALVDGSAQTPTLAATINAPFEQPPPDAPLMGLPLSEATLWLRQWLPLQPMPWHALMLFSSREVEDNRATGQLVGVDWPLVVLHRLSLDAIYLQDYRDTIAPALERNVQRLEAALTNTLRPELLTIRNPGTIQRALSRLAGPQYALLESLGVAEYCMRQAKRESQNLEVVAHRVAHTPLAGIPPPASEAEAVNMTLTERPRHFLAQMEVDVARAQHLVDRTTRAVAVLRAQAESLGARYQRLLPVVVAAVAAGLAIRAMVDKTTAPVIYGVLREWVNWNPLPDPGKNPGALLVVQTASIVIGAIFIFLLLRFIMKVARW